MPERLPLEPVERLEITTLVDNTIDALLSGDETISRRPWGPLVANRFIDAPGVRTTLVAEHGFAALVTMERAGERHTLLFDAGLSPNGLIDNMDRLEISPWDIEAVVLSHGHFDHTGGLHGLANRLGTLSMPMLIHPGAYAQRRSAPPTGDLTPLPPPSRSALEGGGFDVIDSIDPSFIFDGGILITGEVPRLTDFEQGFPFFQVQRDGIWEPEPHLMDDQALIANVEGKGLVVLTGCGHAGIVNIVRRAQAITGEQRVHAVIGGFHLPGAHFERSIPRVVDAMRGFAPHILVPGHCTGYKAQQALAAALPEAFVQNAVGTTLRF